MRGSAVQPLALGLLAALALLLRGAAAAAPPTTSANTAPAGTIPRETKANVAGAMAPAAASVLAEFLGPDTGDPIVRARTSGYQLQALIAIVPHPTRSRLAIIFDEHVQALQRALEDADYLLDRQSLPWKPGGKDDSGDAPSVPGVLLFRAKAEARLLFVLLVPEWPTSGIDKAALAVALETVAAIQGPTAKDDYRILGPTFSGSATSLRLALATWTRTAAAAPRIRIVSGSVTDAASGRALGAPLDGASISFQTTVHSDDYVERLFFNYLRNRDRFFPQTACPMQAPDDPEIRRKVAFLVEANTAYGSGLRPSAEARRDEDGFLRIPFPMHIGALRAEWSKLAAGRKPGPIDIPPQAIDLPTEDVGYGSDVVPSFATLGTRIDDLVLANVLPVIQHQGIAYVGLVATDALDRLFLGRMVRQHCPDVTVFALGADLLYTHPEYARDLEGMLVASTYPLFTDNELWTLPHRGREARIQFPTSEAEGVFNATLALIDRPELMLEYGLPLQPHAREVEDEERHQRQPPVWVSAVGRGALWPLAALCLREPPAAAGSALESGGGEPLMYVPPPQAGDAGHPLTSTVTSPTIFWLYALAFLILCGLHAVGFAVVAGRQARFPAAWRLFTVFEPSRYPSRRFAQRLYLQGSFLVLSLAYAWIAVPPVLRLSLDLRTAPFEIGFEVMLQILGWVLLLAPMIAIARASRRAASNRATRLGAGVAVAAAALPLVLIVVTFAYAFGSLADLWRRTPVEPAWLASFYVRASSLGSGLSPLLPMLFLGIALYLWSFCELRRLHLGESARDHSIVVELAGEGTGLRKLKATIDGLLRDSRANLRRCGGTFVLVTVFFAITVDLLPASLDGRSFVWLFELLLFLVSVAVSFEFTRFLLCWLALKRLLRQLGWLPLGAAFKRVPETIGSQRVLDLARARPDLPALKISLDKWEAMAAAWSSVSAGRLDRPAAARRARLLGPDIEAARKTLRAAQEAEACRPWRLEEHRRVLQRQLNAAQIAVVHLLRAGAGDDQGRAAAEDFLAMGVVVFLRLMLAHLRNLLGFSTGASLFVLLAISSYPFQPAHRLLSLSWVAVLTLVALTVAVFVHMDRDEVLSWINKTPPGQVVLNREFASRLATYGLVPLVGMAAAQFPDIGRFLFFWVQPFMNALK
jgi:hypothetical protein